MVGGNTNIFVAFLAGLLSFVSPCVLPLVPAYLGHLIGATTTSIAPTLDSSYSNSESELVITSTGAARFRKRNSGRLFAVSYALAFVFGFSLVFVTFWTSISTLGAFLPDYVRYVRPLGGLLLILLGLNMAGVFRIAFFSRSFNFVGRTTKFSIAAPKPPGLVSSFFTGVIFAAGWTPCIGPVLGSIIGLASEDGTVLQGMYLLVAYSLGLGVPFILCALALGRVTPFIKALNRRLNGANLVSIVSGVFVALVGVLMLTNLFATLPQYFNWLPL